MMIRSEPTDKTMNRKAAKSHKNRCFQISGTARKQIKHTLTVLGLAGLVAGCAPQSSIVSQANAQVPASLTPFPTNTPSPVSPTTTPTFTPSPTITPTATPWPTPTAMPSATPWAVPVTWNPTRLQVPTLEPIPVVATVAPAVAQGIMPVNYSPPDGVDVFGSGFLRWEYFGQLAEDEWFDIKIKPFGSENSAFVDWTKSKEYPLHAWTGWSPGLYTWQIGIVKGYKEGETKHFVADTGRDSQKFIIKWQSAGGGGSGGGGNAGGGSAGGGTSGGS